MARFVLCNYIECCEVSHDKRGIALDVAGSDSNAADEDHGDLSKPRRRSTLSCPLYVYLSRKFMITHQKYVCAKKHSRQFR